MAKIQREKYITQMYHIFKKKPDNSGIVWLNKPDGKGVKGGTKLSNSFLN